MVKATYNGVVIAESDSTVIVEGNHYFPPESINRAVLRDSAHKTVCSWKGTASYYDLVVDGKESTNAAWYYPAPSDAVNNIANYIAFYSVVNIE